MLLQSKLVNAADLIEQVVLVPAYHNADETNHIHVLQDLLLKARDPGYVEHPDFAIGVAYGRTYYEHNTPFEALTLAAMVAFIKDNLARHDHNDLNALYAHYGWPITGYAYRVGFVVGWLVAVIEHKKAPISHSYGERS